MVISVGEEEQRRGKDVVGKHLSIVLALLLDINNDDLLDPETPLSEVVELLKTGDLAEGPTLPHAVDIEPEFRVVYDVLYNY